MARTSTSRYSTNLYQHFINILVHSKYARTARSLRLSLCFIELGHPLFIGYDLLFSLVCTLAIHLGDWAGNGNVSYIATSPRLNALMNFVRRLPPLPDRIVESSVAVSSE